MICQNTNKSRFKVLVNFRDKLLPFSRCPNLNIERCTLNGFSPSNPFLKSNMQNFEVSDFPLCLSIGVHKHFLANFIKKWCRKKHFSYRPEIEKIRHTYQR